MDHASKQPIRWEYGINRIADLALLNHEQQDKEYKQISKNKINNNYIEDEWERFTIKFSIYYPLKD